MIDLIEYRRELNTNLANITQLFVGLSPAQIEWAPDGSWSLLQIAEHILLTEEMVMGILGKGSDKFAEKLELFGSEKLNQLLVGLRARKVKAPGLLEPQGSIRTPEEFQAAIMRSRDQLLGHLESGEWMISTETYKHPMLGEMTVSDWLFFILHHAERHQLQMKDRLIALNEITAN